MPTADHPTCLLRPIAAAALALALVATSCGPEAAPVATVGYRAGPGLFDLDRFETLESELEVDFVFAPQNADRRSPQAMNRSTFGLLAADTATLPGLADSVQLVLSVPLAFGDANAETGAGRAQIESGLRTTAAGIHDDSYRRVATRLVEAGYPDAILRLGPSFNSAGTPWSSITNEDEYIAAYRHVHDVFASVSDDFRFDWSADRGSWFDWGAKAYPGDDYVDIMGITVYWRVLRRRVPWDLATWERAYLAVLRDHLAFAREHGKPVSYPEWALRGADVPRFVEAFREWLDELPTLGPGSLVYHAYHDDGDQTDLTRFPRSAAAFSELFGRG